MDIDKQRQRYDEIVREISDLDVEEKAELEKQNYDMYNLHLIAQERATLEDEIYEL